MATEDDGPVETALGEDGTAKVPAEIRRCLDLGPGDMLRWGLADSGELTVEVVRQREGVFDDFDPVDAGETDAVAAEREFGSE